MKDYSYSKKATTPEGREVKVTFSHGELLGTWVFANYLGGRMYAPGNIDHRNAIPTEKELYDAEQDALRNLDTYCNLKGVI